MALKIFTFLLLIFAGVITYLSIDDSIFKKPQEIKKDFPAIDFSTLSSYKITKDGVEFKITADRVLKYDNKDEMYNIDAKFLEGNITKSVSANRAILKQDIIFLKDEIVYSGDGMVLFSNSLEYDINDHVAISNSKFKLKAKNSIVTGDAFKYDSKNGLFDAINVEFRIK